MQIKSWQIVLLGIVLYFLIRPLLLCINSAGYIDGNCHFDTNLILWFITIPLNFISILLLGFIYDPFMSLILILSVIALIFHFFNKPHFLNSISIIIFFTSILFAFSDLDRGYNIRKIFADFLLYGGILGFFIIYANYHLRKESKIPS